MTGEAWFTHREGLARKGHELADARHRAGITQTQLAAALADRCRRFPVSTDATEISRIENGLMIPSTELGLALSLWMADTRLQTPMSVDVGSPAWSHPNRRFDTPAAVQPAAVPNLFDAGLAPVPVVTPQHDTIGESFEAFHQANPWVMDALVRLARDMRAGGRDVIGIKMLFEVLRWQHARNTIDAHSGFKLDNNYAPHYARRIMADHPDLDGMFHLRKQTTP